MISIFERPKRNSGIIGGKFLEKTRVPKPGSSVEKPEFYGPADFAIGATVEGNAGPHLIYVTQGIKHMRDVLLQEINQHHGGVMKQRYCYWIIPLISQCCSCYLDIASPLTLETPYCT